MLPSPHQDERGRAAPSTTKTGAGATVRILGVPHCAACVRPHGAGAGAARLWVSSASSVYVLLIIAERRGRG